MPLNDARKFVEKLRDDHNFRENALNTTGPEELSSFLESETLRFNQRELVGAMAVCMAQLEQEMKR